MKTLVIASHPDDEVLGCGGTMARLASNGHEVYSLILGEGAVSRHAQANAQTKKETEQLYQNSLKANKILGCKEVFHESFPDNKFDTVPLLDIVKSIELILKKVNPEWVFTQHGGDLNIDHSLVFRATLTATRPQPGNTVKSVFAFQVPSSTEWAFQKIAPTFNPSVFFDITDTLTRKIEALSCYESELRAFPHPRSAQALTAIAQQWGSTVGLPAAEPFHLIREIR